MNREIKFRGKRVDNGEWVEGYYFLTPLTDEATNSKPEDGWSFLSGRQRHCISKGSCVYEVIPETVSQYVELKDKNEKEIFAGDVLKAIDNLDVREKIEFYGYVDFKNGSFVITDDFITHYRWMDYEVEVIGNIYDNPEILENLGS